MILTEKDTGKTIKFEVNAEFQVRLKEVPTSGYLWKIKHKDDFLVEIDHPVVAESTEESAGSGNDRIFHFVIKGVLTSSLVISLCRPWDESDCIDTFIVFFAI